MKALYAYTAVAYANAGLTIPNTVINVWQPVGASPFLQYQTNNNAFQLAGKELLYYNSQCFLAARFYDVLPTLTADEVLTFGYKVRANGSWGGRFQVDHTALYDANGAVDNVLTHLDIVDFSTDLVSYVEVVIDPNAMLLTGYINGKRIRSIAIPAGRNLTDTACGMGRANNNGSSVLYDHFYAGICKKSEGPVIMGAWTCEDLVETASDLRDGDGVMNRNTVNETTKTITFKLPEPGAEVAVDIKAINPNIMSKLIAISSDGKTTNTKELTKILSTYAGNGDWPSTSRRLNSGRNVASATPDAAATSLTVKLRAQYMQE